MSAIDKVPSNLNFLNPLEFKFLIKKSPHVNFFLQSVNIPGFDLPSTDQPNPFTQIPHPGDHINWQDLEITFKIDENFQNYIEVYTWITQLGFPESYDQYRTIDSKTIFSGEGKRSDVSIIVNTNLGNPNYEFIFRDAFPISLSGFNLNTTEEDIQYIDCTANFKYTYFNINAIPK